MDTLRRFTYGGRTYTFDPDAQVALRDNFRDVVPRTTRLPGLDGGFDQYGTLPAPAEIGLVDVTFWVEQGTYAAMQDALDDVRAMASWGQGRLYKQRLDPDEDELFVYARINSIEIAQNARDMPHRRQRVQIKFQVADPAWLARGTEAATWGSGVVWGGATPWGGDASPQSCTGTQTDYTETATGNAETHPRILIDIPAGQSATDVIVQRLEEGVVRDQVRYNATLSAGDSLIINCRDKSVKLNGSDAYTTAFTTLHQAWMRLQPGDNDIRVIMDNAGDECEVTLRYYERWR